MNDEATERFAYTDQLKELIEQRLRLVHVLVNLAESQAEAIESDEVSITLGILARKQQIIEQLSLNRDHLEQYASDDPELRSWRSIETRQQCQRASLEAERLLQQVVQREEATIATASQRRSAIAAQLQSGQDSILATNAYRADSALHESSIDFGEF